MPTSVALPRRMRAVAFDRFGGPEVLRTEDVDTPMPGRGEVAVRVAAVSVGRLLDVSARAGTHPYAKIRLPHVLGAEHAGTVAAVGAGVESVRVGDLVAVFPVLTCGVCPACRAGSTEAWGLRGSWASTRGAATRSTRSPRRERLRCPCRGRPRGGRGARALRTGRAEPVRRGRAPAGRVGVGLRRLVRARFVDGRARGAPRRPRHRGIAVGGEAGAARRVAGRCGARSDRSGLRRAGAGADGWGRCRPGRRQPRRCRDVEDDRGRPRRARADRDLRRLPRRPGGAGSAAALLPFATDHRRAQRQPAQRPSPVGRRGRRLPPAGRPRLPDLPSRRGAPLPRGQRQHRPRRAHDGRQRLERPRNA